MKIYTVAQLVIWTLATLFAVLWITTDHKGLFFCLLLWALFLSWDLRQAKHTTR